VNIYYPKREKKDYDSCLEENPYQNFRIKVLISEQKYLGRRKRDIIYVGIALTTELSRPSEIKDELSNQ
jgi:hypothetical protein